MSRDTSPSPATEPGAAAPTVHPTRPTTAMVLAAGLGKRMRPLTATTPKPLIEVCGRSLINHCLDRLVAAGIRRAVVNVHYLADLVEVHVRNRTEPEIVISDERKKLLETGGGIVKALPLLGEAPFILLNSDSFWIEGTTANLDRMMRAFDETRMDALLMLSSTVTSIGYEGQGDFFMTPDGKLAWRAERSVAPFAYAGAAILHPRLFAGAPEEPFSLTRLFNEAIENERLYGLRMEGTWLHVGTPPAVTAAERAIRASSD